MGASVIGTVGNHNRNAPEAPISPRTLPSDSNPDPAPDSWPVKAPTLVQVARLAGVGIGTASRVLNNEGYVSERTAARVREVIAQIGYKPNEVARNLKVRRSGAIGIVVPSLSDPSVAASVEAAQAVIRRSGNIAILTFTEGSPEVEAREIDYLVRRQVDGILMIPVGGDAEHLSAIALQGKPLVTFDVLLPGRPIDAAVVRNKEGAIAATGHLLSHGHRRIAALGSDEDRYTTQRRVEGYREAMESARLTPEVRMVESDAEAAAQLEEWFVRDDAPTAIFSLNAETSVRLLTAIEARGIRVPEQLAVFGFDDLPLAGLLATPLSVVRQPAAELGAQAATLLVERMSNLAAPTRRVTLETELMLRRSCGCA